MKIHKKTISVENQYFLFVNKYKPLIKSSFIKKGKAELVIILKPSEIMREYKVKIKFEISKLPKVYVIEPNLNNENKDKKPPHMFSLEEGRICINMPTEIDFNDKYTKIVPWISEWLFHYEIWRSTGVWHGRGHEFDKKTA